MYVKPSSLLDSQAPNVMVAEGPECTNSGRRLQPTTHKCCSGLDYQIGVNCPMLPPRCCNIRQFAGLYLLLRR
jgi:hypothetical protein